MPAELPWSEVLRRRNGLPPTELDACVLTEVDGQPVRYHGQGQLTPEAAEALGALVTVARQQLAAAEPRCDLYDLPTTMCHHCQETADAQP